MAKHICGSFIVTQQFYNNLWMKLSGTIYMTEQKMQSKNS